MTFNIHQLEGLDYDDVEPILEEYIHNAINAFVESPEGEAYIKDYPVGGSWIGLFSETAYNYEGLTLPTMTKTGVQMVMEYVLPRKVILMNPSEADDAIPELVAFWGFLQRKYKLSSAGAIIKYLKTLTSKFPAMMGDRKQGGLTKNFLLSGLEAGFDMTSQEGLDSFKEMYNSNLKEETEPSSPLGVLQSLVDQLATRSPFDEDEDEEPGLNAIAESHETPLEPTQQFQQDIFQQMGGTDLHPLTEADIQQLQQQTFTESEPGTILKDFQTLLDRIGETGIEVNENKHQFPAKTVAELNQSLSEPIQIGLKRPIQKSYPVIHGLYQLLRTTGLVAIRKKGKKNIMVINQDIKTSWDSLNLAERYGTLLEAWLVRAHGEILGDHAGGLNEGTKCIFAWKNFPKQGKKVKKYADQDYFVFYPDLYNLALMKLFGLIELTQGKPESGKGWRFTRIKPTPWGNAVMNIIRNAYHERLMNWEVDDNPLTSFGELQPYFQPYLSQWQQNLVLSPHEFCPGLYTFKVSLDKIWRRIAISGEQSLYALSDLILDSVGFDDDDLHKFSYLTAFGRTVHIFDPEIEENLIAEEDLLTEEVRIGDLPLKEGASLSYLFDFDNNSQFNLEIERISPNDIRPNYAEVIESHGDAPEQYPTTWEADF